MSPTNAMSTTLAPSNQTGSSGAFANFDNPNINFNQQSPEKKPAFEGSHLVNLNNLIEDPSSKQTAQAEKKTLGQTLQQRQTTSKPVMQGGVLAPTPTIGAPMVGVQPVVNPLLNPMAVNTQNLTPQQLQQLQLQYQMQLLALQQQQQLQGGRGY